MPFVYILQCADQTYYTGWTTDVKKRMAAHNRGKASRYTRSRRPVVLVYLETVGSKTEALKREHGIKQLRRVEKEALVNNTNTPASW